MCREASDGASWTQRLTKLLACLAALSGCRAPAAYGQTPSPLQEWQYPGGAILQQLFGVPVPKWQRILGAAASVEPIYEGAHAYRFSGGPVINIRYRNIAFASVGEGLGLNLIHTKHLRAGVAVGYDVGRRSSSDYHLHGLPDIDLAAVPKIFFEWAVAKHFPLILRTDVRRMIRSDDGYIGDVEAYVPLPGSSRRFVMFAGASYTFASQRHMQKSFGITLEQAHSSMLPVFLAHGGSDAEGAGFSATLFLTQHWLVNVDAAVERLLASASESPVTEQSVQRTFDLSTAYRW